MRSAITSPRPAASMGFKSEMVGRSRAKEGVMRRLSMVALRATARHVLRGRVVVRPVVHPQKGAAV